MAAPAKPCGHRGASPAEVCVSRQPVDWVFSLEALEELRSPPLDLDLCFPSGKAVPSCLQTAKHNTVSSQGKTPFGFPAGRWRVRFGKGCVFYRSLCYLRFMVKTNPVTTQMLLIPINLTSSRSSPSLRGVAVLLAPSLSRRQQRRPSPDSFMADG